MNVDSEIERLVVVCCAADDEYEKQLVLTRQLRTAFERDRLALKPAEFASQKARLDQQEMKFEFARKNCQDKNEQLDILRSAEAARLGRELAEEAVSAKTTEFNEFRTRLLGRRSQLEQLQRELPIEEIRLGRLMRELNDAKNALNALAQIPASMDGAPQLLAR